MALPTLGREANVGSTGKRPDGFDVLEQVFSYSSMKLPFRISHLIAYDLIA